MKFAIRYVLLVTALVVARSGVAWGQLGCSGSTCTVEISLPVSDVLRLSLSSASVSLGSPTESDYTAGYRDAPVVNVVTKANRAVQVQIGGLSSTFSYSGSLTNPMKAASDLKWALSAAALSSTSTNMGAPATLLNQGAGSTTTSLYLRTLWSFSRDVPGTYSLAISLTLSAP